MPEMILSENLRQAISRTFVALKFPNFRLWFVGQLFSLAGTWMQSTAQGYLIFALTQSNAYLGYVGFANGLPSWLFTLYGGLIADRIPRRLLMAITQTGMMVLAVILSVLTFTGMVQPWHIISLAFLLGIFNAFETPARQAFVSDLVDRETLTNAIAINAMMFNAAMVFGPAIGGLVYAWAGPGWCFAINGISFFFVIGALLLMKFGPIKPAPRQRALDDIRTGLRFVMHDKYVLLLIVGIGFLSMFGFGVIPLIPAFAVDVLGGDVRTNGLLLSARGIGALIAAVATAALAFRGIRGKLWVMGSFLLPVALALLGSTRSVPLALAWMALTGLSFIGVANNSNALVQSHIPDDLRGRVMSIYSLVFLGGTPIGSLWAGTLADHFGTPAAFLINAGILFLFAVYMWFKHPQVRNFR